MNNEMIEFLKSIGAVEELTPQEQATLDMIIIQYDQRFDKNK